MRNEKEKEYGLALTSIGKDVGASSPFRDSTVLPFVVPPEESKKEGKERIEKKKEGRPGINQDVGIRDLLSI
jgi:hypothetical protein